MRTIAAAPEGPGTAVLAASGWDPVMGDGARLAKQLRELLADGFRVVVAADGKGSAGRITQLLADEGLSLPLIEPGGRLPPGGSVVVEPLERGFVLPATKLAVLSESDVTGRRRAHRRPRPRRSQDGINMRMTVTDTRVARRSSRKACPRSMPRRCKATTAGSKR